MMFISTSKSTVMYNNQVIAVTEFRLYKECFTDDYFQFTAKITDNKNVYNLQCPYVLPIDPEYLLRMNISFDYNYVAMNPNGWAIPFSIAISNNLEGTQLYIPQITPDSKMLE